MLSTSSSAANAPTGPASRRRRCCARSKSRRARIRTRCPRGRAGVDPEQVFRWRRLRRREGRYEPGRVAGQAGGNAGAAIDRPSSLGSSLWASRSFREVTPCSSPRAQSRSCRRSTAWPSCGTGEAGRRRPRRPCPRPWQSSGAERSAASCRRRTLASARRSRWCPAASTSSSCRYWSCRHPRRRPGSGRNQHPVRREGDTRGRRRGRALPRRARRPPIVAERLLVATGRRPNVEGF